MDRLEEIKKEMECWKHCDSYYAYWHNYIKEDMVRWLISEIERLNKVIQTQADISERLDIVKESKDKEIERLRKEKEWLINNWVKDKHYINNLWAVDQLSMNTHKEKILSEMQQTLGEG